MQLLFLLSFSALVSFFQGDFLVPDLPQIPPPKNADASLCLGIKVHVKVFLEGPYAGSNLMNDNLRTNNGAAINGSQCLIPTTQPYSSLSGFTHTGTESCAASVFGNNGDNSIVDWVLLELRDKTNPATVIETRAALLQKDGDIVDVVTDASGFANSDVAFSTSTSCDVEYLIAVRHRNHLGVRTNTAKTFGTTSTGTDVDFTSVAFPIAYTNGTNSPLKTLPGSTVLGMYAGDSNRDGDINVTDRNVDWRVQNGQNIILSPPSTYNYLTLSADFNLDGSADTSDRNLFWRLNNGIVQQL